MCFWPFYTQILTKNLKFKKHLNLWGFWQNYKISYFYKDQSIIRRRRIRIIRQKCSLNWLKIFSERVWGPLWRKNTSPTTYPHIRHHISDIDFFSCFSKNPFLVKLDHYCPISRFQIFTRGNFRFLGWYSMFGVEIDSNFFQRQFGG